MPVDPNQQSLQKRKLKWYHNHKNDEGFSENRSAYRKRKYKFDTAMQGAANDDERLAIKARYAAELAEEQRAREEKKAVQVAAAKAAKKAARDLEKARKKKSKPPSVKKVTKSSDAEYAAYIAASFATTLSADSRANSVSSVSSSESAPPSVAAIASPSVLPTVIYPTEMGGAPHSAPPPSDPECDEAEARFLVELFNEPLFDEWCSNLLGSDPGSS